MPSGTPDYCRPGLENWRMPFSSDDALRLQIMRYSIQNMRLSMFERHISVTETRHPLGTAAAVLVVAGETQDGLPDAAAVHAFLLDGAQGIMFHRAIWHGLDCFPARSAYVDYLMLSDAATEDEIEAQAAPVSGQHTHVFDFGTVGLTLQVTDPKGLIS